MTLTWQRVILIVDPLNLLTPFGVSLTLSRCITSPNLSASQSQSESCIVCGQQALWTLIEAEWLQPICKLLESISSVCATPCRLE